MTTHCKNNIPCDNKAIDYSEEILDIEAFNHIGLEQIPDDEVINLIDVEKILDKHINLLLYPDLPLVIQKRIQTPKTNTLNKKLKVFINDIIEFSENKTKNLENKKSIDPQFNEGFVYKSALQNKELVKEAILFPLSLIPKNMLTLTFVEDFFDSILHPCFYLLRTNGENYDFIIRNKRDFKKGLIKVNRTPHKKKATEKLANIAYLNNFTAPTNEKVATSFKCFIIQIYLVFSAVITFIPDKLKRETRIKPYSPLIFNTSTTRYHITATNLSLNLIYSLGLSSYILNYKKFNLILNSFKTKEEPLSDLFSLCEQILCFELDDSHEDKYPFRLSIHNAFIDFFQKRIEIINKNEN